MAYAGRSASRANMAAAAIPDLPTSPPIYSRALFLTVPYGFAWYLASFAQKLFATSGLVFMDVQMPEIDGIEATLAIRQKEKTTGNHQPVIALTAHAMKGDEERCLKAGWSN
jgi:CheY-like chemotaxis protein